MKKINTLYSNYLEVNLSQDYVLLCAVSVFISSSGCYWCE